MNGAVLAALVVTLAIEVPLVAIVFRGQRARMALVCAVTTGATNLFMNTAFRTWIPERGLAITLGELGALAIEAAVYALASRPRDVPRALLASALANAASYAAGFVL
jgi:hypothetical protein